MHKIAILPELKQVIGALLFAARKPLSAEDIRQVLARVAEEEGGVYADYAGLKRKDVEEGILALQRDLETAPVGLQVTAVGTGYRLENLAACGPWLRRLLDKGKPNRLSRPALETLAIIAYRQPCTRAEIEAVRGVAVDQIVKSLLELQLIRVAGRSELPGRPWLFGTTQRFLEQFGLKTVEDLPSAHELRKLGDLKPAGRPPPSPEGSPEVPATPEATEPSDESDQSDQSDLSDNDESALSREPALPADPDAGRIDLADEEGGVPR